MIHLTDRADTRPTRLLILGGFLGAGKTTLAVMMGRQLRERYDRSVAIITNDQGDVLVDTEFTKSAGFDVKEVLGGCFCANFDEFVKSARSLVQMGRPDVIIAEPIGTSTNLLASVVAPLKTLYPKEFDVAPFMVVVDATRAHAVLEEGAGEGLIPSHQIKEAEYILLSKIDLLNGDEVSSTLRALREKFPDARILACSAVTGENVERVIQVLLSNETSQKLPVGDPQSAFAHEKASLGWYSGSAVLFPEGRVDLYELTTGIIRKVAHEFDPASIAHVKVVVHSPNAAAKVSLVGDSMQVDGLRGSRYLKDRGTIVINARIIASPTKLKEVMEAAIRSLEEGMPIKLSDVRESCFTPRPEAPSHFFEG